MDRKQRTVLSCLALLLSAAIRVAAQPVETKSEGKSPSPEFTVPLGETVGDFTFSKSGVLSYKGRDFTPFVQVKVDSAESAKSFRISSSRDGHWAGAIAEDFLEEDAYLLDLSTLVATPLQKVETVRWAGKKEIFWSPSGRYMLALCEDMCQRFVSVDLRKKRVRDGYFLSRRGNSWTIVDEPRWSRDSLIFTVDEAGDDFGPSDDYSEKGYIPSVQVTYAVSLNPANLKITKRKIG